MQEQKAKIIPIYFAHFINTIKERYVILQGSSRSGKTYSILQWFFYLAVKGVTFDITIVGRTIPFLRDGAVKLFKEIAPDYQLIKNPFECRINNATFLFRSFEDVSDAKGAERDYLFVNECNDIPKDIIDQLIIRTRKQCFFDFNPVKKFWTDEIINEVNFLQTTFKDNPYLSGAQLESFRQMKENAEKENASAYDKYFYQVYYLGEYGDLIGNVFNKIRKVSYNEYFTETEFVKKIYGLDFGYSDDPCALVELSAFEKKIYIRQLYYKNETDDFQLAEIIKENCEGNFPIVCDFGGGGDARMANLYRIVKRNFVRAIKGPGSKMHSVKMMQGYDLYLCGEDMFREFCGYEFDEDGKLKDGNDHCVDASLYALTTALKYNYFKSINFEP